MDERQKNERRDNERAKAQLAARDKLVEQWQQLVEGVPNRHPLAQSNSRRFALFAQDAKGHWHFDREFATQAITAENIGIVRKGVDNLIAKGGVCKDGGLLVKQRDSKFETHLRPSERARELDIGSTSVFVTDQGRYRRADQTRWTTAMTSEDSSKLVQPMITVGEKRIPFVNLVAWSFREEIQIFAEAESEFAGCTTFKQFQEKITGNRLVVDHLCHYCKEEHWLQHLEVVTPRENLRRAAAKQKGKGQVPESSTMLRPRGMAGVPREGWTARECARQLWGTDIEGKGATTETLISSKKIENFGRGISAAARNAENDEKTDFFYKPHGLRRFHFEIVKPKWVPNTIKTGNYNGVEYTICSAGGLVKDKYGWTPGRVSHSSQRRMLPGDIQVHRVIAAICHPKKYQMALQTEKKGGGAAIVRHFPRRHDPENPKTNAGDNLVWSNVQSQNAKDRWTDARRDAIEFERKRHAELKHFFA